MTTDDRKRLARTVDECTRAINLHRKTVARIQRGNLNLSFLDDVAEGLAITYTKLSIVAYELKAKCGQKQ
jgi:hypothetical protein